ncbi:GTPase-activating protein [Geranomyces michiganensis]|nr:GTPase-activating protein [Geranomyces michiganensis]
MQRDSAGVVSVPRAGSGPLTIDTNGNVSPDGSVGEISSSTTRRTEPNGTELEVADSSSRNESLGDLSGLIPTRRARPLVSPVIVGSPSSLGTPMMQEPTSERPDIFHRRTTPVQKSFSGDKPPSATFSRPPMPQRGKTVTTGFSTVTPSRPTILGKAQMQAGQGSPCSSRRPSSGSLNGSHRNRSKSENFSSAMLGSASSANPPSGTISPRRQNSNVDQEVNGAAPGSQTPRARRPSLQSVDSASSTPNPSVDGHDEDTYFVLHRLAEEKEATAEAAANLAEQPPNVKEAKEETKKTWFSPSSYLQASFQAVKDSMMGEGGPREDEVETDWEFWGKVMNDYENTVRKHPRTFTRKIHLGIPDSLRGMVWQLICKGKDPDLENQYATLLQRTSIHEKVIQRDLARTFPKHERFQEPGGPGQESLFNIIKSYSLYDTEIGYCQGIAFVVGALLLNMPDEEAFCVLVRLMRNYNLRDLYTPQMIGLQLRLYQFDELLMEQFPAVAKHLDSQEVKSNMYASQWFMTMFAYRFPLSAVFRIMDVIFAEGVDSMLRFALALIKRNADAIVLLEFEQLLEFLKNGLFEVYAENVNALILDAAAVKVTKSRLDKLAADHAEIVKLAGPEHMELEALRAEARRMNETIRRMELEYEILNREHVTLANSYLEQTVRADNSTALAGQLRERVTELESREATFEEAAYAKAADDVSRLANKNLELTTRCAELAEENDALREDVRITKERCAAAENDRAELERKWEGLKRALG